MTRRPSALRSVALGTVAVAVAVGSLVACGSTAKQTATTSTVSTPPTKGPSSKVPAAVTRVVERLEAGEDPGGAQPGFSESGVAVRGDGELQLEFHSAGPLTDAQTAELTALGAEIVAAGTAEGIVDAWVPFARVDEAAGLGWVAAVTIPSPTRTR